MTISDAEEETESENERLVYVAGFKNKASRTLQIGRAPESDLVVSFKGMSKRHAFMMKTFRSETFLIMDNHSMNGTKVNGEALEEGEKRPLEFGDQISFGSKIIAKFHSAESLYGLLQE